MENIQPYQIGNFLRWAREKYKLKWHRQIMQKERKKKVNFVQTIKLRIYNYTEKSNEIILNAAVKVINV